MRDRLARGFIAGLTAGVAMNVISHIFFNLGWAELRYLDWAGVMIYGYRPVTFYEVAFAQLAQLIFVGVLGVVFACLIPLLTSRNYHLRGWLFSSFIWFLLHGITLLFDVEATIPMHVGTAATNLIGASVYGITLAEVLRMLDHKIKA
ncbi:MAG: hypothetical protein AB1815_10315 [Bacillota bacterium]|jgi:hypothetical protein